MKLRFSISSFRFRIILTLTLVITVLSFFSLYFFNYSLSKKLFRDAENDIVSFLYFFRDQMISIHDGRTIRPSLDDLSKSENVIAAYLFSPKGQLLYPPGSLSKVGDSLDFNALTNDNDDIFLTTIERGTEHFSRASIRFSNSPACYSCHSPDKKILGFVVLDFSLHNYTDTVAFTRRFSIIFTILMISLILLFVLILHYRFIKRSLANFKSTINTINSGDLQSRVMIPESKELSELGKSFNTMVDHLQVAQIELQRYHQKELQEKQKLATIGEMSARLAHEIRNPITGIANAVEIIIDESHDEQNKPVLEEIRRQANRVNKAISNLLNYSRSKELNLQKGDVNEIIRSVEFFLDKQVSHKAINFNLSLDDFIPEFFFDSEKIENVLLNLGMNAVHSIENEGEIIISSLFDQKLNRVVITFRDNGHGIPEEKLREIFNPFFTLKTEGTGLGLAIAKEIVELHNGEISAENNTDKGCTFHISLPVKLTN